MEYYIKNKNRIEEFKKDARVFAEEKLDWNKNAGLIQAAFTDSSIVRDKTEVLQKIAKFERMKENKILKAIYKIKILKFDAIRLFWDFIQRKMEKVL